MKNLPYIANPEVWEEPEHKLAIEDFWCNGKSNGFSTFYRKSLRVFNFNSSEDLAEIGKLILKPLSHREILEYFDITYFKYYKLRKIILTFAKLRDEFTPEQLSDIEHTNYKFYYDYKLSNKYLSPIFDLFEKNELDIESLDNEQCTIILSNLVNRETCPYCQNTKIYKCSTGFKFKCGMCNYKFNLFTGTIFPKY